MPKKQTSLKYIVLIFLILILIFGAFLTYKFLNQSESDPLKLAQQISKDCQKKPTDCFARRFQLLTKNNHLELVLASFDQIQIIDPRARGCHLTAHYIAIEETAKNPAGWKELFSKFNPNICGSGFIHGILEAHTRYDSSFEINRQTIAEVCGYISTLASGTACDHILGHILLAQERGDIPKAISVCSQADKKFQYGCFTGAFMENLTRENLVAHQIAEEVKWDQNLVKSQTAVCELYTGQTAKACFKEMAHLYDGISKSHPPAVYSNCQKISNPEFSKTCYEHALDIMIVSSRIKKEDISLICKPFEGNDMQLTSCFEYAVRSALKVSTRFADRAQSLCSSLEKEFSDNCFNKLVENLKEYSSADRLGELCASLPIKYQPTCRG